MNSNSEVIEQLIRERDEARDAARVFWDFIEEGDFMEGIDYPETDTPEWELWIKKHVAIDVAYRFRDWLKVPCND